MKRHTIGYRVTFPDGTCQVFALFADADREARARHAVITVTLWRYI